MKQSNPTWSHQTKVIVIVILLALGAFLLYTYSDAIPPILIACILAFVLNPLVSRLEKKLHIKRGVAIVIVYLGISLLVGLILFLGIPLLFAQLRKSNIDTQSIMAQLQPIFQDQINFLGMTLPASDILSGIQNSLRLLPELVITNLGGMVTRAFESLVKVVLTLMISIYLINDSAKVMGWLMGKVPPAYLQDYTILKDEINLIWSAFFRGQLILSLIVATILTVECYAIGLRFAPLMGILGGLFEFMPSVGHAIWLALAVTLALLGGSTWLPIPQWSMVMIVVILHLVFTQFDLNYLIPRIIGRQVRLSPLVVLVGIVIGISIAGVGGIVLAAPTIATLRVLGRYIFGRLMDTEPLIAQTDVAVDLPPPDLRLWKKHPVQRDSPD
jgi:predicted PurR-regulated permease PerM